MGWLLSLVSGWDVAWFVLASVVCVGGIGVRFSLVCDGYCDLCRWTGGIGDGCCFVSVRWLSGFVSLIAGVGGLRSAPSLSLAVTCLVSLYVGRQLLLGLCRRQLLSVCCRFVAWLSVSLLLG